jgi:glycosyltransferase involved in cell wall biosynthesis
LEGTALRLAVDAANLAQDRRGMGRIGRAVLHEAAKDERVELTLLAEKRPDVRSLREQFPGVAVRRPATARHRRRYDAIWYPFNGMRFDAVAPALVTIHDVFAFTHPHAERVARWREQTPIRRAARDAARILANSTWTRDEIVRVLGVAPERIDVVRPSPDPFWFPALGDELPLGGRRFALLVGVRERRKNARLALEACARALSGPDEALVVVGELDARDRAFARALRLRCAEVSASDELLRALYRNASAVLVPSLAEGFGLVAVEAMACGAPVVAADAAALPEATEGLALLLDPSDAGAWARAIRELFDDEGLASALRARAAGRFAFADRSGSARRTLAILRELARARGASTRRA